MAKLVQEFLFELLFEFQLEKQMNSFYINLFSIDLDQPNGGLAENCVTTFKESEDVNVFNQDGSTSTITSTSTSWYDRPCIEENDVFGDVGHKFMCECNVPDQNRNPQVCTNDAGFLFS